MIVTQTLEFDKKRVKVFIDGEFAFVLYKGELREYGITEGNEVEESTLLEIRNTVLSKRCKLRAMNLLQKKDYTEKQLRDKLMEGLYPTDIISDAISYVKSYRYLDDERYANDYISYHMSTRSRTRIKQDLMNKGISGDIIENALESLYANEDPDIELEQVLVLLNKKHYDPDNTEYKEKQKLIAFLLRRGFPMSVIKKAMNAEDI